MADTYNDYTGNLNAIVKPKYEKGEINNLYPDTTPLIAMIGKLQSARKVGSKFLWPVSLSYSQGHTYAAAGSGAFAFEDAVPEQTKMAEVDGVNHLHREVIDYETLERTAEDKVPEGAFEAAGDRLVKNLRTGMLTRLEESFWYGGTNMGEVDTAVANGSDVDLKLTYDSWASLNFIGKKNAKYDAYLLDSAGSRPTSTKYNTNAALVLKKIKVSTRTLTLSGNAADITALITAVGNVANKVGLLYFKQKGNDTNGLDYAVTNTGIMYGIDAAEWELWEGNTSTNSDLQMTLSRIYNHLDGPVSKGLNIQGMNGTSGIDVWLNPCVFRDLVSQETILKRYMESSGGKARNGFSGLTYDSEVGPMTFYPYSRVKQGELFMLPTQKVCSKVGAAEPYLKNFNSGATEQKEYQYLRQLEGKAGCEAVMYGHLGFVLSRPAWTVKVTGIRSSNYVA